MKLYIIRHGETAWNKKLLLQGQTDIPLNDNGRKLAQVTARALQNIPFDLCITSPLKRAKETAEIVLKDRCIPLLEDARIQEICFGTYEGRRVKDENGVLTDPVFQNFFSHPERFIPPEGAESLQQLLTRTAVFMEELSKKTALTDKSILISTHGAASRALLSYLKGTELSDFWDGCVPPNCAVTIAELITQTDHRKEKTHTQHWEIIEQDKIYYENC